MTKLSNLNIYNYINIYINNFNEKQKYLNHPIEKKYFRSKFNNNK